MPRRDTRLEYAGKLSERRIISDTPAASLQCSAEHHVVDPDEWANMLVHGDNMQVLRRLLADKQAGKLRNADGTPGVRLVYIDPPFGTEQDFAGHQDAPAYRDRVVGAEFIEQLRRRLVLLARLLSDDGSIYVHLDEKRSHYIKIVLDEIFGEQGFQREIIWRIGWVSGYKSKAKNWIRNHDTILYYSKDPQRFIFNKSYIPYPEGYRRRDGKQPTGEGVPLEDTWNCSEADSLNSIQIVSFSQEKTGYPTQKSEALLDRIIRASSNPGDLVLDAFCGSGTTCAVAEKTGRRWIGVDVGKLAICTTQARLLRLARHGHGLPRPFRRFHAGAGLDDNCAPEAVWTIATASGETELRLRKFQSNAMPERGAPPRSFAGLSSVLIDFDYRGVFRPGFFALRDDFEKVDHRCRVDPATVGQAVMLAAFDVYGNESRSVLEPALGSRRSTAKKSR